MTSLKRLRVARALSALAVLALPALAANPLDATPPTGVRGASTPLGDTRQARVIVKFKADSSLVRESALSARGPDQAPVQHAARLSQRLGLALRDGRTVAPRTQVVHADNVSSADLVAQLQADPDVEYAEVDARVRIAAAPNDPRYPGGQTQITPVVGQWYLRAPDATAVSAINAEAAWDVTTGSPSVVVAVIDTGVRLDHPDLAGKLLPGYDFVSADSPGVFATANDGDGPDADPSDPGDWVTQAEANGVFAADGCMPGNSTWHGTQTAALIGASTNNGVGMASVGRDVRILPVRALGKCGGFQSDIVAAMLWAAGVSNNPVVNPNPAKVLNLSLGSTGACGTTYQNAINQIVAAGVSVVVAAGNDEGLAVGKPANCVGAIGVGGLRHIGTKVGFSDVGPELTVSAPGGNCVNDVGPCLFPILTATNDGATGPGNNIFSDGFNISVGTSFSAPLVAGTLGLMLSANPTLSPAQVRVGVMQTSRAFPTTGADADVVACRAPDSNVQDECYCTTSTCGAGMLNAAGAAAAAASLSAWITSPTTQLNVGSSMQLDSSTSWAVAPHTITNRAWSIAGGDGRVALSVTADQRMATVSGSNAGTVVVHLVITDDAGNRASTDNTIAVVGGSSDGGGTTSWPWLLALGVAAGTLRRRR
ncbi:MAG TPA: S8 family peptidase [Burkholderiaceae bacterium]|nr:S8 family peptidase [Burkholderiaceae bacterium]